MELAVFGDSYTRRSGEPQQLGQLDLSWPEWLVSWGHTVSNYGHGGTSLWYTHQLFLEHHHRHDRVVVMVTEARRQPIRGFTEVCTNGAENLQWQIEHRDWTPDGVRALRAARDHLLWAQNALYCQHIHRLMVKELQELRPDALFVPCFPPPPLPVTEHIDYFCGWTPQIQGWQGHTLWDVSELDHHQFDLDLVKITADHRHCHMNEQNNRQFAQEIQTWLSQGTQPLRDVSIYHRPSRPISHYFGYKD